MTDPAVIAAAYLPLSRAMICPEEHIFDVSVGDCPACGSAPVMPLATWLGSVKDASEPREAAARIVAWAEMKIQANLKAWKS